MHLKLRKGLVLAICAGLSFCATPDLKVNPQNNSTQSHKSAVMKVLFSPDGKVAISGGNDSNVMFWGGQNGRYIRTLEGEYDKIMDMVFLRNSRDFITANYSGSIILWGPGGKKKSVALENDFIAAMDISYPDHVLITASWNGSVKVLDLEKLSVLKQCQSKDLKIKTIRYSEKTKSIYAGTASGYLYRWPLDSCESAADFHEQISLDAINAMDLNDALNLLVLGLADSKIKVYQLDTLKLKDTDKTHKSSVNAVHINEKMMQVISADKEGRIIIKSLENKKVKSFIGHTDAINSLDVSPDGSRLVSGSNDLTVKFWDLKKISQMSR